MKKLLSCLLLLVICFMQVVAQSQEEGHNHTKPSSESSKEEWRKLLNQPAPEFQLDEWVNSESLSIKDLKGKVVLVRWWLETCPYCKATAPSLNEFHEEYADDGLVIIGMYHPKPLGRTVSKEEVREFGDAKEFKFPLAIDQDWAVLNSYWPKHIDMSYTSVSFLLDKEGVIRYIHPGGSYSVLGQPYNDPKWTKDYHEIKANIKALLKEEK